MTKFYTAVGMIKYRRGEKGMTYPYVEIGKNEYHLDMQEMVLWSVLNWRILSADEIKNLYEKKINELGLGYHKTMDACQYHLMQRGLIAEGKGESPADALYDLLSNLYVVPVSENIFLRLFSFVKLTFKGVPFKATNHSGGILGGMSDGSPIFLRASFKPTPSIAQTQTMLGSDGFCHDESIHGRHDPIIVARAVPVVEAMVMLTLADHLLIGMGSKVEHLKKIYR